MDEFDQDEPMAVTLAGHAIGLYRIDDTVYALDNICTHEFATLSHGEVVGDAIECPLHAARFHIPTGRVLDPPAEDDLRTYPVKVEGNDIFVGLPKA